MNGPEHYREAEKCTDSAARASLADGEAAYYLGLAQVHATLALAAATLMNRDAIRPSEISEWFNGGAR